MYGAKSALRPLCFAAMVCLPGGAFLLAQSQAHWEVVDKKDGITGATTFYAFANVDVEDNGRVGRVEVKATCDASTLEFQFSYHSSPQLELKRIQGRPFGFFGETVVPPLVANVRTNMDGHVSQLQVQSPYTNAISLRISHLQAEPTRNRERFAMLNPEAKFWAIEPVLQARSIRVELPLANGDAPIVEISPQEPAFRQFASRCYGASHERPGSGASAAPGASNQRPAIQHFSTADEFAAAFPELLRQASSRIGLDPAQYEKESRFVINAVKICSELTIPMAKAIEGTNPNGLPMQGDGGKYATCYQGVELVSQKVNSGGRPAERGITLLVKAVATNWRTPPKSWTDGDQLSVIVFYTGTNPANPMNMAAQDAVPIASAKIDRAK